MRVRGSRNPLGLFITFVATVIVLAVAALVTFLWPQALLAGITIACLGLIGAMIAVVMLSGRYWLLWFAGPAVALAALGTVMLAEDLALSKDGELTEALVIDHTLDVDTVHDANGSRTVYVHEYVLEGEDGQRLAQPMEYRGESGFDGIDEGDTITVLVDPAGRAPTQPADQVDIGADVGILSVGAVLSLGAFGICMLVVGMRGRIIRTPE